MAGPTGAGPGADSGIRLLLIGRGYVARRLTGGAGADGTGAPPLDAIGATHRPDGAPRRAGDIRFGDSTAAEGLLERATHLLVSVPPDADGDPTLRWLGADRLAALPALRWIGYLSSTGVYGDHDGAWVDEESPLRPAGPTGQRRARAEREWLAARQRGLPVALFRLAGIYGPGRSSFDALDAGTARRIDKPGHVFCRCHVDDICAVLRRSMAGEGRAGGAAPATLRPARPVYNVADDLPAPQSDVVGHAAGLIGVTPPPLVPWDPDAMPPTLRRFYEACRRVGNGRIVRELGVRLRHPTYREGLRAIAREEGRL